MSLIRPLVTGLYALQCITYTRINYDLIDHSAFRPFTKIDLYSKSSVHCRFVPVSSLDSLTCRIEVARPLNKSTDVVPQLNLNLNLRCDRLNSTNTLIRHRGLSTKL